MSKVKCTKLKASYKTHSQVKIQRGGVGRERVEGKMTGVSERGEREPEKRKGQEKERGRSTEKLLWFTRSDFIVNETVTSFSRIYVTYTPCRPLRST